MEQFIEKVTNINDPKTLFLVCGVFIFADVITGYLKAFKNKKVNSSISRDGYIKKIGWIVSLLVGFFVDTLIEINIFLIGSALVCITTEAISLYENLGEIGNKEFPFKKYFIKLAEIGEEKNDTKEN